MTYNKLSRFTLVLLLGLFFLNISYAAAEVLNVEVSEFANENVLYNPLQASSGLYADSGEVISEYTISGLVNITNIHPTQAIQDVLINITGISNIYNVSNLAGTLGYVSEINLVGDYMLLFIPDLGSGSFVAFSYDVNTTNVAPPINLTASYSDNRIFAGLPITITDTIENMLNPVDYPDNCIYNISLIHRALSLNNSGAMLDVLLDNIGGVDSLNAVLSGDQRNISWNTLSGGCLNSGLTTDITYEALTPAGINNAGNYEIVNTTMSYSFNSSFSRISLDSIVALVDLDIEFEKYLNNTLSGDNATWRITSQVINPSNIDVNLTQVSHWVSVRDATGTGFTNPSVLDVDTISGIPLTFDYNPGVLLNSTTAPWTNNGLDWYFNYTFSASPIVWMDIDAQVVDDGFQLQNRTLSYGENIVYIKELYLATGYWLQISRNITRLSDNEFNIVIDVVNLGTSPTPANQAVQVFNFIHSSFNLTSPFVFSNSPWYNTVSANETLVDPVYDGVMYQFAIMANNPINASLDAYGGSPNQNNSWSVTYNVTGSGEFNFEDLFLTGVDPLNVGEVGGTKSVVVEGVFSFLGTKTEYVLGIAALVIGLLVIFV